MVVLRPSCVHVQEPDGGEPVDVRAQVQLASTESSSGAVTSTTSPSSAWASGWGSEIVKLAQSLHQQPLLELTAASVSSSSQPDLRNEPLARPHFPITFMPEAYCQPECRQGGTPLGGESARLGADATEAGEGGAQGLIERRVRLAAQEGDKLPVIEQERARPQVANLPHPKRRFDSKRRAHDC